jgi:AraC family transcriptional regulator
MGRRAYGDDFGDCFGLDQAPALVSQTLRKTTIAATQLKCAVPPLAPTKSLPLEDAFLVSLQISGYPAHEFWLDGKALKVGPYEPGDTVIFDVKDDPIARIDHSFHSVFFYLPRSALDMIADGADAPRI